MYKLFLLSNVEHNITSMSILVGTTVNHALVVIVEYSGGREILAEKSSKGGLRPTMCRANIGLTESKGDRL